MEGAMKPSLRVRIKRKLCVGLRIRFFRHNLFVCPFTWEKQYYKTLAKSWKENPSWGFLIAIEPYKTKAYIDGWPKSDPWRVSKDINGKIQLIRIRSFVLGRYGFGWIPDWVPNVGGTIKWIVKI